MDPNFKHDTGLFGLWQVVEFYGFEETAVKKELNFEVDILFRRLEPNDSIEALKKASQSRSLVEEDFKSTQDYTLVTRDLPTALTWSIGTVLYDDIVIAQIANRRHKLIRNKSVAVNIPEKLSFIHRHQKNEKGQFLLQQSKYLPDHYKKLSGGAFYQFSSNRFHYVVPCVAIFKAYYNTSRGMYQSILSEHILDSNTKIIDGSKSKFTDGNAHVQLRSHLTNQDAKFAARFFLGRHSSRTRAVLETCRLLSKSQTTQGSHKLELYSAPPFIGTTVWRLNYFEIGSEDGKMTRFITDILSCSFEWGFEFCTYRRDNPGDKSPPNEDREVKEKEKEKEKSRESKPPSSEDSSGTPENNHLAFKIPAQNVCSFENVPHSLELEYPTKEDPKYIGVEVPFSPERGKGNGAKGETDGRTGRVHAETNKTRSIQNLQLGELSILEALAVIFQSDLKVDQITVSDHVFKFDGRVFDFFPIPEKLKIKGAKKPAFYYADKDKKYIRLVSTVRINAGNNFLYYIDIEKRIENKIGCIFIRSLNEVREEIPYESILNILNKVSEETSIALKGIAPDAKEKQKYTIIENIAYYRKRHTVFPNDRKNAYITMLKKLNDCGLNVKKQLAFLRSFETIGTSDLIPLRDQYKKLNQNSDYT